MKRYSLWVKCLVFFLAVVTLLSVAVSGLGILAAESMSMYRQDSYEDWCYDQHSDLANEIAYHMMRSYGGELSECPEWLLEQVGYLYIHDNLKNWYNLTEDDWYYIIRDKNGKVVHSTAEQTALNNVVEFTFNGMKTEYPVIVGRAERPLAADAADYEWAEPEPSAPTTVNFNYAESFWDPTNGDEVFVQYTTTASHQVTVGISTDYTGYYRTNGLSQGMLKWLFAAKYTLVAVAAVSFLLFAVVFIFLLSLAGKDPKTGEVNPRALNRLPLDLYLAAAILISSLGCIGAYQLLNMLFGKNGYNVLVIVLLCGCGIVVATTDVGFFTAVAAQFKVPGQFWWHHSLCGRIFGWIGKGCCFAAAALRRLFKVLPLIWEWLAIGFALGFGMLILMLIGFETNVWLLIFLWCLLGAAVIAYGGWCYGTICKGIKRMRAGDLNEKINTKWMHGSFKTIAEDLNALADVVILAAEKQLKSERMKAELITNVSHDIKTPLTSVINYVDLLQQPHTEEEGAQYLEVLSRQSLKLKKLVEDLMDMSKASSGNVTVNAAPMDAVEAVNQALGEFADKLELAELTPVFRPQMPQMPVVADGRITWRVLSNLLSNVVKYALPGTRVYLDLMQLDGQVFLSVKNISREELNISAEELTERFVRGDASRNTEGSGLGLNIAQSLMRLQRGNMEVLVDGDLFKVTLMFPTE